jgi:hypothetical protein
MDVLVRAETEADARRLAQTKAGNETQDIYLGNARRCPWPALRVTKGASQYLPNAEPRFGLPGQRGQAISS